MKPNNTLGVHDIFVFIGLESLGTLAIMGNLFLIIVLLRNRYLHRASFILMLSLAVADVLHGLVTTCFFYPPIVLKTVAMPHIGIRVFNIIDWTAWSITLTHMSAICLDRCIAIMLYSSYNQLITVKRIKTFSISCWAFFLAINTTYFAFNFCCLIAPLSSSSFYTFGYDEELKKITSASFTGNAYVYTYTPLEILTLCILSVSNPITLVQLYRRHKRKVALRMASTMLLEMSIRMGSKHYQSDVREVAARRANRQQQRILLQISVVAAIFYSYMTAYYLIYHIFEIESKWVMLFNSFFYSTTHMINPVIYFSLNKEMRAQLVRALSDLLNFLCCIHTKNSNNETFGGSIMRHSLERKTSHKVDNSFCTATETSPLFSSTHPRKKHNAAKAVAELKKESFTSSLNHLVESSQHTNTSSERSTVIISSIEKPRTSIEQAKSPATQVTPVTTCLHEIPQTIISTEKAVVDEIKIIENKLLEAHEAQQQVILPIDAAEEQLRKARDARRTLLEALIKALDVFSDDESEIEEIKAKISRPTTSGAQYKTFVQSKSFDSPSRHKNGASIKSSQTLQQVRLEKIDLAGPSQSIQLERQQKETLRVENSPESSTSYSDPQSSNSERYSQLTSTEEWQKWKDSKISKQKVEKLRESLTMLIDETNVESDYDEDEVIFL
uniref:G-protein coupled receptors family 1 profile domain-containing protein n=1 Tax=Acrobeloides nanus TaxID=290746 RepID=A0A914C1G3_9BILA